MPSRVCNSVPYNGSNPVLPQGSMSALGTPWPIRRLRNRPRFAECYIYILTSLCKFYYHGYMGNTETSVITRIYE